jgi:hypothetical protein
VLGLEFELLLELRKSIHNRSISKHCEQVRIPWPIHSVFVSLRHQVRERFSLQVFKGNCLD